MRKKSAFFRSAIRAAGFLATSALALGLGACDKMKEPTVGQKLDAAVKKTEQSAAEAKYKAEQAMQSTQTRVEQGAAKVEAAAQDAGGKVVAVADDAVTTAQVLAGLAKDNDLSAIKIDVDTRDGVVTLSGSAPTQSAKERATTIAQGVKGVKMVVNQLVPKTH